MSRTQCLLALLALCVGLAHSLSWDIVLANDKQLDFYNNGKKTLTESPPFRQYINWLTYDPMQNRLLYSTNFNSDFFLNTYDIESGVPQRYYKKYPDDYLKNYAYDPVEELLFASSGNKLYVFSLKSGSTGDVNGTVVLNYEQERSWFHGVAVDNCGRYIYWISDTYKIERARYDGTGREVIVDNNSNVYRQCLTIENQRLYWVDNPKDNDYEYFVRSSDLNGNNEITLYSENKYLVPSSLAISKDFIYWMNINDRFFWKLPKNLPQGTDVTPEHVRTNRRAQGIAVNYGNEELNQTIQDCKAQRGVSDSHNTDASKLCQNYCVRGDCSVSVLGPPRCRCEAGYSGDRCETYACHNYCLNNGVCSLNERSEPVCQCTGEFQGERCDVPVFLKKCVETVSLLKDFLSADVASVRLGKAVESTCSSTVV